MFAHSNIRNARVRLVQCSTELKTKNHTINEEIVVSNHGKFSKELFLTYCLKITLPSAKTPGNKFLLNKGIERERKQPKGWSTLA